MAPGSFKCSKCERTFSMAAHLARHQNTIHNAGGKRKPGRKSKMKRRPGRPAGPGRPAKRRVGRPRGSLGAAAMSRGLGGDGAMRLLGHMQGYFAQLNARRAALDTQIAGIESAIGSMGGKLRASASGLGGKRRGRPPLTAASASGRGARPGSLRDSIVRVLRQRGSALSPKEIAASVVKAGYKSKSSDLARAVNNTLPKVAGIRKIGRGLYSA